MYGFWSLGGIPPPLPPRCWCMLNSLTYLSVILALLEQWRFLATLVYLGLRSPFLSEERRFWLVDFGHQSFVPSSSFHVFVLLNAVLWVRRRGRGRGSQPHLNFDEKINSRIGLDLAPLCCCYWANNVMFAFPTSVFKQLSIHSRHQITLHSINVLSRCKANVPSLPCRNFRTKWLILVKLQDPLMR